MRTLLYLLVWCPLFSAAKNPSTACENLYSKTIYALSHTKNALKATNFEHQMYYAERAMTMMESAKPLISNCGCANSDEKNYQAIQSLSRALNPVDWEAGRFYSKKALAEIKLLITSLDICTNETYEEPKFTNENTADSSKSLEASEDSVQPAENLRENFKELESSLSEMLQSLQTKMETNNDSPYATNSEKHQYVEKVRALLARKLEELE